MSKFITRAVWAPSAYTGLIKLKYSPPEVGVVGMSRVLLVIVVVPPRQEVLVLERMLKHLLHLEKLLVLEVGILPLVFGVVVVGVHNVTALSGCLFKLEVSLVVAFLQVAFQEVVFIAGVITAFTANVV